MASPWWLPFGAVPEIDPSLLHRALERGEPFQLVDVRTSLEFSRGHIRGAVHLPVTELPAGLDRLTLDSARPVVAICLSAHRSIPAVRLLAGRGLDARQLAGGMLAWHARGLPVVSS